MVRKGLLFSLPILIVVIAVSAYGWVTIPGDAQLPVHWGLDGQADRYGSKFEALVLMPLLLAGLVVLFTILPAIDPRGQNLRRSSTAYLTAWFATLGFMALVHVSVVLTAVGVLPEDGSEHLPTLISAGIGMLFIVIGNVLGKARPNWFMGIRTPWTLSSDLSWDRTHRLTGRLWVLGGIIILVSVFMLPVQWAFSVMMAAALGPAIIGVIYSYIVWRNDPDRETASPEEMD